MRVVCWMKKRMLYIQQWYCSKSPFSDTIFTLSINYLKYITIPLIQFYAFNVIFFAYCNSWMHHVSNIES